MQQKKTNSGGVRERTDFDVAVSHLWQHLCSLSVQFLICKDGVIEPTLG